MNPIVKAVDDVIRRIPIQILNEVFQQRSYRWRDTPVSIQEQITNLVVRSRVFVDCNLVGGTEANIPLEGLSAELVDNYMTVYHIPKHLTQNRSIMSVLSLGFGSSSLLGQAGGTLASFEQCSVTPALIAGQAMMNAMSSMPVVSTAKVQLIGENTVLVKDVAPPVASSYLRCVLANDENMSHIQMRSIPVFCKLVEYAVKSHVFNELAIPMDQGQLQGGQTLGRFKDIVDQYADSEEQYQDYLMNKWMKVSFMNDRESHDRFLRTMIGGYR